VQQKNLYSYLFLTIIVSFLFYKQQEILQKRVALVVKESAFVYAGPEQSFHTLYQLKSEILCSVLTEEFLMMLKYHKSI
jgi:hypothetical protein